MPKLEIATTTLLDAQHAQQGGADSIEISRDLAAGGLTPPLEIVQRVRDVVNININVIVRPHDRDFIYTPSEISQILADTAALAQIGIDGIVFGALTATGEFDNALVREVINTAQDVPITLHRALDECTNPEQTLTELAGSVPRILTSGPAVTAWAGRAGLREWVQRFGQDFSFVASGGLKPGHLAEYIATVHAHEYHFGNAARTDAMVDVKKVRQLWTIIKNN